MLGLERVLTEDLPRTAAGTELRRHQVDALAGMLAELIASTQRSAEENGNGNGSGNGAVAEAELDEEAEDDFDAGFVEEKELEPEFHGADPGAVRRYRFRHPTASGKTIAAAGFVEAARRLGILILTHRRLLVSQFKRDLTTEGYGDRFTDAVLKGSRAPRENPITIQTYAWFARHGGELDRDDVPLRPLRRGAHGTRREDERRDPRVPRAALHRDDGDRAADREAGLGRLPGLGRRPPARATPPGAA